MRLHIFTIGLLGFGTVLEGFIIDGQSDDWVGSASTQFIDPAGDALREGADLASLEVNHDVNTLYVKVAYASPYPAFQPNLVLYVDVDDNTGTGFSYLGRGMDVSWNMPADSGSWNLGDNRGLNRGTFVSRSLYNPETGLLEAAIPHGLLPAATHGGQIAVAVYDPQSLDRAPDFGDEALIHRFDRPAREVYPEGTLAKRNPHDLRVLSWNVLRDAPLNANLEARFGRVLAATRPDIICFQEMYDASTPWAIEFVREYIPLGPGEGTWTARKNSDCITVSRFPIISSRFVDNNLVTQIDTTSIMGMESWILNAHTPCCENQEGRQRESDNFMQRLRNDMTAARTANEEPFAIILAGDMNTGSSAREMITMVDGDIFNNLLDGPDFFPDWDDSSLTDTGALHTHDRRIDTWRSLANRSNTSRLDYIFYSDSNLFLKRSFVLNTRLVPDEFLTANNLNLADTDGADHLPVFADFSSRVPEQPWDDTQLQGDGWIVATRLGHIYYMDHPYIFSTERGWMFQLQDASGTGTGWFYDYDEGWLWILREIFPWYWSLSGGDWRYFPQS